ncbi:amidohydrolase family protein [Bacillus horti]|uniref:Imidazolonepropionase-like amidohydrolase n=1 Tax=Caldalkalibacillus horti TaxID=77523 RepID=A0ABT9VY72_9BACI|nr:amidohydrolase family protein [Bacillus horti]MDQ0165943.1 imidazolonepropionase-like amidohydrolase [Bacillus horti]
MSTLVKAKGIIKGTGEDIIHNGAMLIEEGKIVSVGTQAQYGTDYSEILDFTDVYVMPGLIDAHTHLSVVPALGNQIEQLKLPPHRNVLRSLPNIQKNLASGVTSMRIMGEEHFIDIEIKKAIKEGLLKGPRLLVSGKGIVASNGHGVAHTTSDGEQEVRKNSRLNFAQGADFLKLFVTGGMSSPNSSVDHCFYTREEIAAAVEEAERVGSYVAAHAHGGRGLDYCIAEGVRTIEHAALISEAQLEQLVKKDLWIIGTFAILFHPSGIEESDFKYPAIREKVLRAREMEAETFSKVLEYKPNLALGTDSMHGLLGYEAECLVSFGASEKQALEAITLRAAQACRLEDQVGSLEAGKLADFIVLSNNPLERIQNLQHVQHVYQEGVLVHSNDIA